MSGASRTYVVANGAVVCGYYCLAAGAVVREESPKPLQRNMPDPLPVIVLGRLAVDRHYQDRGVGSALLRDAIQRTLLAADVAGITAILVHAISADAKQWYLSRGFLESPIQPMTLCLPLATIRRALAESR
ncbi:MAG: GNAT family N-acetyltransferase [Thermomicrobiales bacterium]|nr:GNAT family N-acetyltransferase [Thermomicrobiales bacterium]